MKRALLAAVALVAATGCGADLERVELEAETVPPLEHVVSADGIILEEGAAIAVRVRAFEEGERTSDRLTVSSQGFGLEAYYVDHDGDTGTRYILMADAPGNGALVVSKADGTSNELAVPFIVPAQTAP